MGMGPPGDPPKLGWDPHQFPQKGMGSPGDPQNRAVTPLTRIDGDGALKTALGPPGRGLRTLKTPQNSPKMGLRTLKTSHHGVENPQDGAEDPQEPPRMGLRTPKTPQTTLGPPEPSRWG